MINKTGFAYILLFGLLCFGCNGKLDSTCNENKICYTESPDELYLVLEMTPSLSDKPVVVTLYKDHIDDGQQIDQFTTNNAEESYLLPVNERYTVTAKYIIGADTIVVIDSERMGDGLYTNCSESCYDWEEEIKLDLKLKK